MYKPNSTKIIETFDFYKQNKQACKKLLEIKKIEMLNQVYHDINQLYSDYCSIYINKDNKNLAYKKALEFCYIIVVKHIEFEKKQLNYENILDILNHIIESTNLADIFNGEYYKRPDINFIQAVEAIQTNNQEYLKNLINNNLIIKYFNILNIEISKDGSIILLEQIEFKEPNDKFLKKQLKNIKEKKENFIYKGKTSIQSIDNENSEESDIEEIESGTHIDVKIEEEFENKMKKFDQKSIQIKKEKVKEKKELKKKKKECKQLSDCSEELEMKEKERKEEKEKKSGRKKGGK